MNRVLLCLGLLLLGGYLPAASQAHRNLPPPPDSLSALLRASSTSTARAAALLRVAWAFEGDGDAPDSVGMLGYAAAAEALGHQLGDAAVLGEADDVRAAYWLDQRDDARAASWLRRAGSRLVGAPPAVRARHLYHYAYFYEDANQNARAIACHRQAIQLYGQAGLRRPQAQLTKEIGIDYQNDDHFDSAIACFFRALPQTRQLGDRKEEVNVLSCIGSVYLMRGDYATSNRYIRATYRAALALGDTAKVAGALLGLAVNADQVDSTARSLHYLRQLAALIRHLPHYEEHANVLAHFGRAFRVTHQFDSSVIYYERSLTLDEQNHSPVWIKGLTLSALSEVRYAQGRLAEADALALQALALNTDSSDHTYVINALHTLRAVAVARRDFSAAYGYLVREQAVTARQEARQHTRLMEEVRAGYEVDEAEQQVRLLTEQRTVTHLRQQRTTAGLTGLLVLALLGAGLGVRAYRRRQQARETGLRTKLAADLHDDVGALLTQITLEASLLQATGTREPALLLAQLDRLTATSRRAKQQMADVVWSIDARNDSMEDLLIRMRDHAFETLPTAGVDLDFHAAEELSALTLPLAARQNLYLIYKEALHNVMKHAGATLLTVRLSREAHALVLRLHDNGRGYGGTGRPGGQGLANMRARAEACGGTLTYDAPAPGEGFGLTLRLPV